MGILSAKVVHYVFVLPKTSIAKNACWMKMPWIVDWVKILGHNSCKNQYDTLSKKLFCLNFEDNNKFRTEAIRFLNYNASGQVSICSLVKAI